MKAPSPVWAQKTDTFFIFYLIDCSKAVQTTWLQSPVVNPCLYEGPFTGRGTKNCKTYLILTLRRKLWRTLPSPKIGILGRVCPRATNPSTPKGKLYSFHMGGTLASHPRTSMAEPVVRVQFFFTAPDLFSCTKNNANFLPSSHRIDCLFTWEHVLAKRGTTQNAKEEFRWKLYRNRGEWFSEQGVPEVDGASGNRGKGSCDERVPASHERVPAMPYEKLATKNNIISL